jgi:hypothetical protein
MAFLELWVALDRMSNALECNSNFPSSSLYPTIVLSFSSENVAWVYKCAVSDYKVCTDTSDPSDPAKERRSEHNAIYSRYRPRKQS